MFVLEFATDPEGPPAGRKVYVTAYAIIYVCTCLSRFFFSCAASSLSSGAFCFNFFLFFLCVFPWSHTAIRTPLPSPAAYNIYVLSLCVDPGEVRLEIRVWFPSRRSFETRPYECVLWVKNSSKGIFLTHLIVYLDENFNARLKVVYKEKHNRYPRRLPYLPI